ncbi:unnamed protein product [Blepharisma stoltei]|uniref:Sfi1 spindle body domain-containing protein n=1 Tax=Blepharisma stoltei TaxID=1481888 RepID=A0AAU9JK77_9CILI|nr:unnamed protein product [Blepharisma stoltei]
MESLKQWNDLRGQYQQKLGRPQTAPRQVRFDFSEKYSLREFRNLRETKALELLNFTSSNLAYSEGQRTPELSVFENPSFSNKLEYAEEYICLIKPNLDIFYISNQIEKEHSGNESYDEWKLQHIREDQEEEKYNDYQQFLKKLNSPQVTQIIENFDEIASKRSSKGIKIEDPYEAEQKSVSSQKEKSIENKENSHEYIDEEIKDAVSNIEKNEKELSDSSFDFNISDSYPLDSLKVSESLRDGQSKAIYLDVFECLTRPEIDIDYYSKRKRSKRSHRSHRSDKLAVSDTNLEETKIEVFEVLIKPESYIDYYSLKERSNSPSTDNKSIHIDSKSGDLSPFSSKSNEEDKLNFKSDEFQRFSKPRADLSYHSIGKKTENSISEHKSIYEENKSGDISPFSYKSNEEKEEENIKLSEFQLFEKPEVDLIYQSIGGKSDKSLQPQEMPLNIANETSDKFISEMDNLISNAEKELDFDIKPDELTFTEPIKIQNRDYIDEQKAYETSLRTRNLLRQENRTTQKPYEALDTWRRETRRPMPKEREINKFIERWEFIHTYQIFQAFIFICKTHRKWINGVKAEFQRRKLINFLQNWKLYKKYKIAKRELAVKKAKRIADKWYNLTINKKRMKIYSYLYWYKSMISKGLLGWKLVTQNMVFNKNRINECRRRHRQRLFYNTFYAWKHMKALVQANNIPIRISTTTSVSKTHGKLREFHSIDIKIMNR